MQLKFRSWLVFAGILAGFGSLASGATVRTVNVEEMVQLADRVFYGRCTSVVSEIDQRSGFPVERYTFEVLEGLKGVEGITTLEVRQVGGTMKIAGLPRYQKGQRLVLFLHGDSAIGLTSPVGMAQGVFAPIRLEDGREGLLNGFRNRNLASDVTVQRAAAAGLSQADLETLQSGTPIPLASLKRMVQTIDGRQKQLEVQ